jgi:hypothetical protein
VAKAWSTFPHNPGPVVSAQDPEYRAFRATAPIPGGFIGMTEKNWSFGPGDPLFQIWTHKDGAQTFDPVPAPPGFQNVAGNFIYKDGIACGVLMLEAGKPGGVCGQVASGIWQSITTPDVYGRDSFAMASTPGGVAFVGGDVGGAQYGSYYIAKDGWLLQTPATGGNP